MKFFANMIAKYIIITIPMATNCSIAIIQPNNNGKINIAVYSNLSRHTVAIPINTRTIVKKVMNISPVLPDVILKIILPSTPSQLIKPLVQIDTLNHPSEYKSYKG